VNQQIATATIPTKITAAGLKTLRRVLSGCSHHIGQSAMARREARLFG
jgi:hypothetical protein